MEAFATVAEYRLDTGDDATPDARVEAALGQQSAKLRSKARIAEGRALTEDQAAMARFLVCDAVRKALKPTAFEGVGDMSGATQASFTANGFSTSYTLQNPSGTPYFDLDTLKALTRSLGTSQAVGTVLPSYGRMA